MNSPFVRWLLDIDVIPEGASGLRLVWEHPWPAWLWMIFILAGGLFALWSYTRLQGNRAVRGGLAIFRFVLIMLVLTVLAGPMIELPRETIEEDWVLMLTDRSSSMTIADVGESADRATRDEQLRELVDENTETWSALEAERHVVWLGFHLGAFNLETTTAAGDDAAERIEIELGGAEGSRTSLDTSLEQALQRATARPVSGIVLMSDGRTTDPPSRQLVRRLQAASIPVFVVPLGAADPRGDLVVDRVDAPRRAFVRDKVPVIVNIDRLGAAVQNVGGTIRLVDDATGEEFDRTEFEPGENLNSVTLIAEPALAGSATWKVIVETERVDLIPENNERTFDVELVDRPLRVLFVEGYPRWEYRYVKNLLIREPTIESSVMLVSADRDFAQEGNQPITRLPRSPEEFADFDVVILGDVAATFFSPDQLNMIRDHIGDRGAGLLWIGGERYTPNTYAGTVLADLLPMRGSLNLAAINQPVNMQPTPLAERLGVLRMSLEDGNVGWPESLSNPAYGWSRLSWAQRIEPGRMKPTAEVLAHTTDDFGAAPLPLVLHMRYGAGQSIYVATDEIWRWRYGRGELLPEQFWVQMIRMLGRESVSAEDAAITLEVSPRRVAVGQPMLIDLKLLDAQLVDPQRQSVVVQLVTLEGETVAELELRRADPDQERFITTFVPNRTGEMRVRVDDPVLTASNVEASVEVYAPDDELRRPEADHPLLAELASTTGGRVLQAQDIRMLPALLPNRSVKTIDPLTERIWDTPLALILILLFVTLEWVGRKIVRLI